MVSNKKILEELLNEPMFGTQKERIRQVLEQLEEESNKRDEEIKPFRDLLDLTFTLWSLGGKASLRLTFHEITKKAAECLNKHKR